MPEPARRTRHNADDPELLCQAAELVIQAQFPSPSMLQRHLWIGYATAANVLDRLEQAGVVGPAAGIRQRDVLVTPDQLQGVLAKLRGEVPTEPPTPSGVLDAATTHMQQYGWLPGEYIQADANPRTSACCPRSAIAIAVGRHPLFAVGWPELCEFYDGDADDLGCLTDEGAAELADLRLIHDTERLLVDQLREQGVRTDDLPPWDAGTVIERWADDEARTLPQILGAMRAASERGRTNG